MAEQGASTHRTKIHARDKDFSLYVRPRGAFTVLIPSGRYSESLLVVLVQDFLQRPGPLAVDLSRLDGVALPLVRALCDRDPAQGRLVFVNLPDRIRALLKLVARDGASEGTPSERDLEGKPEEVEERLRRVRERTHVARTMLESHPCWQLADAESRWLCPFCVTLRPSIRFVARGTPSQGVVDRVVRHLSEECTTYTDGATDGWPFEVLERVIRYSQAAPAGAPPAREESDERRRRLLPRGAPPVENVDLEVVYRPADPPSGDFYDFVRLPDGRRGIVVGEAGGQGVDPSVLLGVARKTLSIRLRETADPSEALARANDDLCDELDQESSVSAVLAIVDGAKRELLVGRAGHVAPFLVRAGAPPLVTRLETPGPVLGFVPSAMLEEGIPVVRHPLRPGDLVLLHTDGLEEIQSPAGERFGADRVSALLQANAASDPTMLLGALMLEAEQFAPSSGRTEDLTLVCLKVR
jgi:serine phosphatase RsbU (regulator of sigma subunit)